MVQLVTMICQLPDCGGSEKAVYENVEVVHPETKKLVPARELAAWRCTKCRNVRWVQYRRSG